MSVGCLSYGDSKGKAHHRLGEYEKELEVARRGRASYPSLSRRYFFYEVRALAALHRNLSFHPLGRAYHESNQSPEA